MAETALLLPRPTHIQDHLRPRTMFSKKLQNSAVPINPNSDPPAAGLTVETGTAGDTYVHERQRPTAPTQRDEDASQVAQAKARLSPPPPSKNNNAHPMVGGCIFAEKAAIFADTKDPELRTALADIGYEGAYYIQTGFDEDVFEARGGVLQEIIVFLGGNIPQTHAAKIAETLHPFPVRIYTPKVTHQYPPPHLGLWKTWEGLGIYVRIRDLGTLAALCSSDASDNQPNTAGPSSGGGGPGRSAGPPEGGGSDKGKRREQDQGDDQREGQGKDQGGGKDTGGHVRPQDKINAKYQFATGRIDISFNSQLTIRWADTGKGPTDYNTQGRVEVKIDNNHEGKSPAPCEGWRIAPWLEVTFKELEAGHGTNTRNSNDYQLGATQVYIRTTGIATDRLAYSPKHTDTEADLIKRVVGRGWMWDLKASLGSAFGLVMGSPVSRNTTNEGSIIRWNVNARVDERETTNNVMWEYTRSGSVFGPQAERSFDPIPRALFGLTRNKVGTPKMEIETLVHFTRAVAAREITQGIAGPSRSGPVGIATRSTFIHRALIALELPMQDGEWSTRLRIDKTLKESEVGTKEYSTMQPLKNLHGESYSEATFKSALEHRSQPTEAQKRKNIRTGSWLWFKHWAHHFLPRKQRTNS